METPNIFLLNPSFVWQQNSPSHQKNSHLSIIQKYCSSPQKPFFPRRNLRSLVQLTQDVKLFDSNIAAPPPAMTAPHKQKVLQRLSFPLKKWPQVKVKAKGGYLGSPVGRFEGHWILGRTLDGRREGRQKLYLQIREAVKNYLADFVR